MKFLSFVFPIFLLTGCSYFQSHPQLEADAIKAGETLVEDAMAPGVPAPAKK